MNVYTFISKWDLGLFVIIGIFSISMFAHASIKPGLPLLEPVGGSVLSDCRQGRHADSERLQAWELVETPWSKVVVTFQLFQQQEVDKWYLRRDAL